MLLFFFNLFLESLLIIVLLFLIILDALGKTHGNFLILYARGDCSGDYFITVFDLDLVLIDYYRFLVKLLKLVYLIPSLDRRRVSLLLLVGV